MIVLVNHGPYYTDVYACFHLSESVQSADFNTGFAHCWYDSQSLQQPSPLDKGIFNILEKGAILIT